MKWKWRCSVVSDSLQSHGLWPNRLLHPWDFPGKNTGVGCHFLLQEIFPTQGLNPGLPCCKQTLYHLVHQASLHQRVGVQFLRCYTTLSFSSITVSVFLFGICSQRTKIFIIKSWDLLQGQQVNLWSAEIVLWNCSLIVMKIVAQSLSHVQLFASPWTAACQDSLSSWSLLKLMTIELGMPSNLSSFVVSLK